MSTVVEVNPLLLVPELIAMAVDDLKLVRREQAFLKDTQSRRCPVDYVIENEQGEQIGVRTPAQGPVEFVLAGDETASVKTTIDRVKQAYARIKVLDEVKRKGYRKVKEERLANGSIRLVVQRWR